VPRISVVVPIYDVEPYLDDCLRSLQAQTATDLEVVMVDDGSHDAGPDIAARYAETDPRFRLIRQANGGLGRARNVATEAASGELLTFVDSDDKLPPDAFARLTQALDRSGADFATGNIHRFDATREWPARFLARAFWRDRRSTHITRFPPLLSDRMAQNKLWRRTFWDGHALRFPEGVFHEDIPVILPAHYRAQAVAVVKAPVYLYRQRETGASITQRRTDLKVLDDRVDAVEQVLDFLTREAPADAPLRYGERVLAEDLAYHLDVFADGDPAYRARFLVRAGGLLQRLDPRAVTRQPAFRRLEWHLVAQGDQEALDEVLRFGRERLPAHPRRWIGGRAYGAYPFLDDPARGIPRSVYRLDTTRRRARLLRDVVGVHPSSR
jgi:CDP-glycerol glycerophosphotransferase